MIHHFHFQVSVQKYEITNLKKLCTSIFILTLFTIEKIGKADVPTYSSMNKWIKM